MTEKMHETEKKIQSLPALFKILFSQFSKQNNPCSLSTFHTTFSGCTMPRHQIISHFIDTAAELYGFNHFTFHFPKAMPPTGIAEYRLTIPSSNHPSSISLFWNHNKTSPEKEGEGLGQGGTVQAAICIETQEEEEKKEEDR
jgi:hypothetical protein